MKKLIFILISVSLFSQDVGTIWTRKHNGPANISDYGQAIAIDENNNIYVAGSEGVPQNKGRVWIRKYDTNGNTLWTNIYDYNPQSTDYTTSSSSYGIFYRSGKIYVSGNTPSHTLILQYNTDGLPALTLTHDAISGVEEGRDIVCDADGNIYVITCGASGTTTAIYIIKFNSSGVWQWTITKSGTQTAEGHAIAIDANNNIYAAGGITGTNTNAWIGKFSPAGATITEYVAQSDLNNCIHDIFVDSNGNVYAVGYVTVTGQGKNIWIQKFNSSLVPQWQPKTYDISGGDDVANGVYVSGDYVYVIGSVSTATEGKNVWIAKLNANDGSEVWKRTYNSTDARDDIGNAIIVDSSGYVYITGCEDAIGEGYNIFVKKYYGNIVLTITTSSLDDATAGVYYSKSLSFECERPPYTWSIISGQLPPGLYLYQDGTISGTPTLAGNYTFTVQIQDNENRIATKSLSIKVNLAISTTSLPTGMEDESYYAELQSIGANPPYTWSIVNGYLPSGLNLSTNGIISGKPTLAGDYSFTVRIVDAIGFSAERNFIIKIGKLVDITTEEYIENPQPGEQPIQKKPGIGAKIQGGEKGVINPTKGEIARVVVRCPSSGRVNVKIYTINGELVDEFSQDVSENEREVLKWHCKNSRGETVSSGIYIAHITGPGINVKKKIAVLR
jgi:flagellar hook assembly protein FlgD